MKIHRPSIQEVAEGFLNRHLEDGETFFARLEKLLKTYFGEALHGGLTSPIHAKSDMQLPFEVASEFVEYSKNYGLNLHRTLERALWVFLTELLRNENLPDVSISVYFDDKSEVVKIGLSTEYSFGVGV